MGDLGDTSLIHILTFDAAFSTKTAEPGNWGLKLWLRGTLQHPSSFVKLFVYLAGNMYHYTLKQSVLLQHTYFCPQKNTQKGENKRTPFHVLPKHTSVSYPNTPWCVPSTHLNLCFMLVLNLTHFQVCSQERCVLSHILMCQQTYLLMCLKKTHC